VVLRRNMFNKVETQASLENLAASGKSALTTMGTENIFIGIRVRDDGGLRRGGGET